MSEYDELAESLRSYSTEMLSYKIDGAFAYAVTAAADAIVQLSTKSRQLEKERDAAIADLKEYCDCDVCKNNNDECLNNGLCKKCSVGKSTRHYWEWRGVQEDNDERTE